MYTSASFTARSLHRPRDRARPGHPTALAWLQTLLLGMLLWLLGSSLAAAQPITVTPATLSDATVGVGYSLSITANGGTAPYTYAITAGSLPAGMSLSSNGALSGTPTAGGTFNFTVTATDSSTGAGP